MALKVSITDATKEDIRLISKHKREFDISIPGKMELKLSQVLVAKLGNELVGFMQIASRNPEEIAITRLAIRNKYTGNGVGRKFVGVARSIAINERKKLYVASRANHSTLNFWENRAKFKEIIEDEYYESNLLRDFELNPAKDRKPRNRKPKGILKFFEPNPPKKQPTRRIK